MAKAQDGLIAAVRTRYQDYSWELVAQDGDGEVHQLLHASRPGLYVRHRYPHTALERLTSRQPSRTAREAAMLAVLKTTGIPAAEVVEHTHAGGESVLITKAVESGQPLTSRPRSEQVQVLLEMAGQLVGKKLTHADLQAGHYVLDRQHTPVLVEATQVAKGHNARSDTIRTFAGVVSRYEVSDEQLLGYLPERFRHDVTMVAAIFARARKINRRRARRMVGEGLKPGVFSEFLKTPEYKAILRRGLPIDLDDVIKVHRENIREGRNVLKCQAKTQVSRVGGWCVKSYQKNPLFTKPYALRAWKGLLTLYANGLPVPDAVACVVFHDRSSLLVMRWLDLPTLDHVLFHDYSGFPPEKRHDIPEKLGEMIGRLHALGIYHNDLKACNILADVDNLVFTLTDTDRVTYYRYLAEKRRIKNLMQIHLSIPKHVSRAFRMRFLKGYTKETREDAKALFSKVWGLSHGMEIVYTTKMGDKFERWDQERTDQE